MDHDDFSAYVAARRARLVRTAVLLGCPAPDAEDLVQTVLVRLLRSWRRVSAAASPDAYVHRMLVNALHDARSRRWTGETPSELPDRCGPEADLATGLVVRRALAALGPDHRSALVLRFYADLSERDAALALGIAPGTVKSRVSRALAALATDADSWSGGSSIRRGPNWRTAA